MVADPQPGPLEAQARDAGDLCLVPVAERGGLHPSRQAGQWTEVRLGVVDDLLADNRRQLGRLLDLYLSGDSPKDVLTDRRRNWKRRSRRWRMSGPTS